MIRLANVLVATADAAAAEAFGARLSHNGYHAIVAATVEQALALADSEHFDLVVAGDAASPTLSLAVALKAAPQFIDVPVIACVPALTAALAAEAFAAGLDEVMTWTLGDSELFARLRPLVRMATMRSELDLRAAIAAEFGEIPSQAAPKTSPPSLIVIGPDQDGLAALLASVGEVAVTPNLYDGESLLERRNFDAAILCVDDNAAASLAFASQVRNNPRLFNLPIVLVSQSESVLDDSYRSGVSRALPRGSDPELIKAVVQTLVRRQQSRWAIRAALSETLKGQTRDALAGTYSRAFLDKYLHLRLALAKTHHRHLAVVVFSIPNVEGVRGQFGDDAAEHLTQQLGQWICGLLRAEDLTAVFGPHEFMVALPDTPLVEVEVVMHRIAGVLAYTDFAVREVYQPIKVWVQVGCANARQTETVEQLIDRARAKLD